MTKIGAIRFCLLRNCFHFCLRCLVFVFLLCITWPLHAQNIDDLHIEKIQDDGLSSNYVSCITQDKNGFMWFGTNEGLFRYDGYTFKAFKNFPGDSSTSMNNQINSFYCDGEHLWVGMKTGLSSVDINSQTIKNIKGPHAFLICNIFPGSDTTLWIGTSIGLYQYNKVTSQWKAIPALVNIFIRSIVDDKKGHLYMISRNGFYCYTKATGACKLYNPVIPLFPKADKNTSYSYNGLCLDSSGNLWLGSWGGGLLHFDTKTEKVTVWSHQTDDVHFSPYKIVMDILQDDNSNIWLANKEGGLTIFNPSKNKFTNYPVDWKSETKISGSVISLYHDRSGIFWIGTENGIYKYDPHRIHLSKTDVLLKTDTGMVDSHTTPITMLKDKEGVWWMGMYEGLFIYDPKTRSLENYNQRAGLQQPLAVFNILQDDDGAIWFTAKNLLVKIIKKPDKGAIGLKTEIYSSPEIQSTLYNLYIDKERRIWVGTTSNGIFRFDPVTHKFINYNYHDLNSRNRIKEISSFCELSKDSLLVGGDQTGLLLLHVNADRFENISFKADNKVADNLTIGTIYKANNDIWIGTEYNGLWRTDDKFKSLSILTINDGLPSMGIASITGDSKNNLWIVSDAGIVQYELNNKKISVFDRKDGIISVYHAVLMPNGNDIEIASRGCIYNFNPANIIKNIFPPKVYIIALKVFDKEYDIQKNQTINLNYTQNYFSLEYVALNYTQPRLNKYAYKMDGLDKKWIIAGARRYVSYANLDEGTYVFNVKACNNEGVWDNVPTRLTIVIKPPFWHRLWFYALVIVFILGVIYTIYRYNINQLKIRLQLRDKIARDLHDDIGSTLSGINIFSKIALQKMSSDQKGSSDLLEKISERSEKTMDALADIVWSINTRNDGMDNFVMKTREYLAEVLEPQCIGYDFIIDPEMENFKVGMILRKELYLIFKEAVCNAYKYSGCSFIHITFTKRKDTCTLTIHDNGKGFDTGIKASGNGIYNMRQRAEKIGAVLLIKSESGSGTTVCLTFGIPRFR